MTGITQSGTLHRPLLIMACVQLEQRACLHWRMSSPDHLQQAYRLQALAVRLLSALSSSSQGKCGNQGSLVASLEGCTIGMHLRAPAQNGYNISNFMVDN